MPMTLEWDWADMTAGALGSFDDGIGMNGMGEAGMNGMNGSLGPGGQGDEGGGEDGGRSRDDGIRRVL